MSLYLFEGPPNLREMHLYMHPLFMLLIFLTSCVFL